VLIRSNTVLIINDLVLYFVGCVSLYKLESIIMQKVVILHSHVGQVVQRVIISIYIISLIYLITILILYISNQNE